MFATAVSVDRITKPNIGAVVLGDDGLRIVFQDLCFQERFGKHVIEFKIIQILDGRLVRILLEAIRDIVGGPTTFGILAKLFGHGGSMPQLNLKIL